MASDMNSLLLKSWHYAQSPCCWQRYACLHELRVHAIHPRSFMWDLAITSLDSIHAPAALALSLMTGFGAGFALAIFHQKGRVKRTIKTVRPAMAIFLSFIAFLLISQRLTTAGWFRVLFHRQVSSVSDKFMQTGYRNSRHPVIHERRKNSCRWRIRRPACWRRICHGHIWLHWLSEVRPGHFMTSSVL